MYYDMNTHIFVNDASIYFNVGIILINIVSMYYVYKYHHVIEILNIHHRFAQFISDLMS